MNIYIYVSNDKYELTLAIADTARELANILGVSKSSIESAILHERSGRYKSSIYKCVDITEDENEATNNLSETKA